MDFSTGSFGLEVGITALASMVQDFIQAKPWGDIVPGAGGRSQDCCEVAQTTDCPRSEDWTEKPLLNRSQRGRGGDGCSIPAAHAFAVGLLPPCFAAVDPHLTRSALHRCLQRHGIPRRSDEEGDNPKRRKFKRYPEGNLHIDIAEVRSEEGRRPPRASDQWPA